jgi:hypothetical protein
MTKENKSGKEHKKVSKAEVITVNTKKLMKRIK